MTISMLPMLGGCAVSLPKGAHGLHNTLLQKLCFEVASPSLLPCLSIQISLRLPASGRPKAMLKFK